MKTARVEQERYWGVTTILKSVLGAGEAIIYSTAEKLARTSLDSRAILDALDAGQGRDAAIDWLIQQRYKTMNAALNRGTDIHKAAYALAIGDTYTIEGELMPWVEQYARWLDKYAPTFLMAEAPVYSHTWRYAGTLDGIMELDGKPLLFDIKTTEHGPNAKTRSGRPKSRPPFPEVALQLVAYAHAEEVGIVPKRGDAGGGRYYIVDPDERREPMPPVEGALCIVVSPEDCVAVPVRIDDEVWQAWLACMNIAQILLSKSFPLFGTPLGSTLIEQLEASL